MLQNAYLDAKIGFDTEESEPPKVWGSIIHYSLFIPLLGGNGDRPSTPDAEADSHPMYAAESIGHVYLVVVAAVLLA